MPTESTVYEYCYSQENCEWVQWMTTIPDFQCNPDMPFAQVRGGRAPQGRMPFLAAALLALLMVFMRTCTPPPHTRARTHARTRIRTDHRAYVRHRALHVPGGPAAGRGQARAVRGRHGHGQDPERHQQAAQQHAGRGACTTGTRPHAVAPLHSHRCCCPQRWCSGCWQQDEALGSPARARPCAPAGAARVPHVQRAHQRQPDAGHHRRQDGEEAQGARGAACGRVWRACGCSAAGA